MAGRPERDPLQGFERIRISGVVGRDQPRHIEQVLRIGRFPALGSVPNAHSPSRAFYAADEFGQGTATSFPWSRAVARSFSEGARSPFVPAFVPDFPPP